MLLFLSRYRFFLKHLFKNTSKHHFFINTVLITANFKNSMFYNFTTNVMDFKYDMGIINSLLNHGVSGSQNNRSPKYDAAQ